MKKKYTRKISTGFIALLFLSLPFGEIRGISPYINKVYDYLPAPGQFVNTMPEYEEGDTKEDIIRKAEESITGDEKGMVSLGGYGGYIVFGFDHMVVNVPGKYDFKIWGNAFYADSNTEEEPGGSCEPGIIMVSYDANGNGIPDDTWYEIAGSEYYKNETIKNYRITYYKPDEDKVRTPDNEYRYLNDTTYIRWTSNENDYGHISRNIYHKQPYYPQWIEDETLTFEGTKLADNYIDKSGKGTGFILTAYNWGYADNHPNDSEKSNINIEWAVDKYWNAVNLPGIHFVKVYTGLNQYCGWLGETSTEIMGAEDLHIDAEPTTFIEKDKVNNNILLLTNPVISHLILSSPYSGDVQIYNSKGEKVISETISNGTNYIECSQLQCGLYIITYNNENIKFIKQ